MGSAVAALLASIVAATAFASPVGTIARAKTPASIDSPNGLSGLFSADDYPSEAIRNSEEGTAAARLTIGPDGKVSACEITASSGSQSLDRTTCDILKQRAHFTPALDRKGKPTIDYWSQRIRWLVPRSAVSDEFTRATFDLNPAAKIACRREGTVGNGDPCKYLDPNFKAFLNLPDRPTSGTLTIEFGQIIGNGEALAKVGRGVGQRLGNLRAVTVKIDERGRVIDCRAAPFQHDTAAADEKCRYSRSARYDELPKRVRGGSDRIMTLYEIVYLRGIKTDPTIENLPNLFVADDYPADAMKLSKEGRVGVKIVVEANGHPSACTVTNTSGFASFDSATCRILLQRGKFLPGSDARGQSSSGEYVGRVAWVLPISPIRDSITKAVLGLTPDGSVTSCVLEGNSNPDVDCDFAESQVELALKSPDAKSNRKLIVEVGELIGDGEAARHAGEAPGSSIWYISAVTIAIGADGKVADCKAVSWVDEDEFTRAECDVAKADRFESIGAGVANRSDRYFTRYESIYFVP